MNRFYSKLSNKIVNSPYLSRWSVLIIDSLVASFATVSVYLILGFFVKSSAPFSCYLLVALLGVVSCIGTFLLFGTHRGIMRHTTIQEVMRISVAVVFKSVLLLAIFIIFRKWIGFTLSNFKLVFSQIADIVGSITLLIALRMFLIYIYELLLASHNKISKRVLIYGDDNKMGKKIDAVVYLNVSDEIILKRLTARMNCRGCDAIYNKIFMPPKTEGICDKCGSELYQRADDSLETAQSRLAVFHKQTQPLIDYYEKLGLLYSCKSTDLDEIVAELATVLE